MRLTTRILLCVLALVVSGCQRSSEAPAPPKAAAPPAAPPAPAASVPRSTVETAAERSSAYTRQHPWGDDTGTSRLSGTTTWAEGAEPPAPLYQPALFLRGVKGTPSEGRYYRIRANDKGEYVFDRILGGEYELSDNLTAGFHWRLRVNVPDGGEMTLDLTPDNSIRVHDDFPPPKSN